MLFTTIFATVICTASSGPQDVRAPTRVQPRSVVSVVSELRVNAARLETGHSSDLFGELAGHVTGDAIGLSVTQAELARQLDDLIRRVLREWLLRDLDQQPSPKAEELSQRLGEPGARLRRAVIAHAEAIALEGILTPRQVKRCRARAIRPGMPPLAGRYLSIPSIGPEDPPEQTLVSFRRTIVSEASYLMVPSLTASELFSALLDAGNEGAPVLSGQRSDLVRRLEKLARLIEKAWLLRGVDENPLPLEKENDPPTRAMEERLSERGKRLRASIVAHAEEIALTAILTPEEAELSKRRMWIRLGVRALMEPELAAVLHLSRSQRDEIAARLENRAFVYLDVKASGLGDHVRAFLDVKSGEMTHAEADALSRRVPEREEQQMAEHDDSIWAVLRPSQIAAVSRLLGKTPPASPKERPPRHAPAG